MPSQQQPVPNQRIPTEQVYVDMQEAGSMQNIIHEVNDVSKLPHETIITESGVGSAVWSQLESLRAKVHFQEDAIQRLSKADLEQAVQLGNMKTNIESMQKVINSKSLEENHVGGHENQENVTGVEDEQVMQDLLSPSMANTTLPVKRKSLHVEPIASQGGATTLLQLESKLKGIQSQVQESTTVLGAPLESPHFMSFPYEQLGHNIPFPTAALYPHQSSLQVHAPMMKKLKVKAPKIKLMGKRPWSGGEDRVLMAAVQSAGAKQEWTEIALALPGRCGKQCRERWVNHLSPTVCKDAWTAQEDAIIFSTRDVSNNKIAVE